MKKEKKVDSDMNKKFNNGETGGYFTDHFDELEKEMEWEYREEFPGVGFCFSLKSQIIAIVVISLMTLIFYFADKYYG